MKKYLDENYSLEVLNDNPDIPFKAVFFRLYDRKIMSGEINFMQLNMDKDAFISLSTNQEHGMSREDIIDLCVNMKLTLKESCDLMESAGYIKEQN